MKASTSAIIAAAALASAGSAQAHHSAAMFDMTKTFSIEGTVKDFDWSNPHAYLSVVVADPGGQAGEWRLEGSSINILARKGWSKTSVKPGDKVQISIHPMRDGSRGGFMLTLKTANSTTLADHDY